VKEEINAAVEWWAKVIQEPKHDNGEPLQSLFANWLTSKLKPLAEDQIESFKKNLTVKIRELLQKYQHYWREGDPRCGEFFRTIAVDYYPCSELAEAAEKAGIDATDLRFPMKTEMWINPGEVKVRHGYSAPIQTIFKLKKKEEAGSDA